MSSSIKEYIHNISTHKECSCSMSLIDFEWRFAGTSPSITKYRLCIRHCPKHHLLSSNSNSFSKMPVGRVILLFKKDGKRVEHIEMDISDFKKFYKEIETIHNMLSIMR